MEKANKIKLGAFIIIATTLIIASFLAIGTLKFFEPRFKAMTVLNASVEGLNVGSPVKYLGVPVGRITRISLRDVDGFINVYFDIYPSAIDVVSKDSPIMFGGPLNSGNIIEQKGLLCFLNASGIMGGSYLELTVTDDQRLALPDLNVNPPPGIFYIRSRNSHVANVIQNIGQMLEQLTRVNFVQLADRIKASLDNADKILNNPELNEMISRWNRVAGEFEASSANFRDLLSKENTKRMIEVIEYTSNTAETLKKCLPPDKITQLTTDLAEAANTLKALLSNVESDRGEITARLNSALRRAEHAFAALAEISAALENDPSQLISGKNSRVIFSPAQTRLPQ